MLSRVCSKYEFRNRLSTDFNQGMTSLLIGEDGNPIYHKRNWRMYAIYRLEHWGLRYVNNAEVTDDDIFEANQVDMTFSVSKALSVQDCNTKEWQCFH